MHPNDQDDNSEVTFNLQASGVNSDPADPAMRGGPRA